MVIRSSKALRNDCNTLPALARETDEPVYITKNGDGDLVVMSIEAFEGYLVIDNVLRYIACSTSVRATPGG